MPDSGESPKCSDVVEVVHQDLNSLISLSPEEKEAVVRKAMRRAGDDNLIKSRQIQIQKARARLTAIDKIITNLYTDNCSLFLIIDLKKPALFYFVFPRYFFKKLSDLYLTDSGFRIEKTPPVTFFKSRLFQSSTFS